MKELIGSDIETITISRDGIVITTTDNKSVDLPGARLWVYSSTLPELFANPKVVEVVKEVGGYRISTSKADLNIEM